MKTNKIKTQPVTFTHTKVVAGKETAYSELKRTLMTCLLWEDNFYEDGVSVVDRIKKLVPKVSFEKLAELTLHARNEQKLRHVPLLVLSQVVKHFNGKKVGDLISQVIQRPDECGELISLYWKDNPDKMIPRQMKFGINRALHNFDEYQLAKWNSSNAAVKLRDVIFLCRTKAGENKERGSLYARLVNKETIPLKTKQGNKVRTVYKLKKDNPGLKSPETWENRLSRGEDKKTVFTEMLQENKLGALALLRNLRGMTESQVKPEIIKNSLLNSKVDRVLPFRFISSAKHAPQFESELETLMFKCLKDSEKLKGHTVLMVDISGSMQDKVSAKSELSRLDAAKGLAMLLREVCESVSIYKYDTSVDFCKPRRGFALSDEIGNTRGGTDTGGCLEKVKQQEKEATRTIILTDEQSYTCIGKPLGQGYMLNVGSYQNGTKKDGNWETITGWSESVVNYIQELEKQ